MTYTKYKIKVLILCLLFLKCKLDLLLKTIPLDWMFWRINQSLRYEKSIKKFCQNLTSLSDYMISSVTGYGQKRFGPRAGQIKIKKFIGLYLELAKASNMVCFVSDLWSSTTQESLVRGNFESALILTVVSFQSGLWPLKSLCAILDWFISVVLDLMSSLYQYWFNENASLGWVLNQNSDHVTS